MGGVEAAVLDGGGGVMRIEGHGLDEAEKAVIIVVDGEKVGRAWTRVPGRDSAGPKDVLIWCNSNETTFVHRLTLQHRIAGQCSFLIGSTILQ
jgi:hypothetical protein